MSQILPLVLFSLSLLINKIESQTDAIQNDLVNVSNKLALDLLNIFPTDGNNFFSPLSITTALLMVMNGAKGVTEQEFRQVFNLNPNTSMVLINENVRTALKSIHQKENEKLILNLANLLLVSNGFTIKPDYRQVLTELFESNIQSVDFKKNNKQVIKNMNKWVSDQTKNKITSIFGDNDSLPEDTPMVLLNAVYFKGMWNYVFDKKDTEKGQFFNFGDYSKEVMVDMMFNNRDMIVKHSRNLQANIFEMPFSNGTDMSMLVILPDAMDGLDMVTKRLTLKTLNYAMKRISKGRTSNERLLFPKFKLETEYELKDHLKSLGLNSLFENSADLSGVTGSKVLKVGQAKHKAFIEVNEEGAEAAAVTKVVYALRSFRVNPTKVDRPFIFAIFDKKSYLIWFLGQIRRLS